MKIALLGFAAEGHAAYEYWNRDGNEITICDRNTELQIPDGAHSQLGDDYLKNLGRFDIIVRTPALHPRLIIEANPDTPSITDKVTTVTNEFLRVCPTKNVIGVTGTKGKGTTSTLIAKMLEAAGKRVHLGGNIGIPALELLQHGIAASDWVVLEMSNFQLIDIRISPSTAVCVMVVPEHLDWHTDLPEYLRAKQQLFVHQKADDRAIYFAGSELSKQVASASPGVLTEYFAPPGAYVDGENIVIQDTIVCRTSDVKLLGAHNLQNVCAAITAVWPVIQDAAPIVEVVSTFTGLEHRLEKVREFESVTYYDDSFGTTPETAMVAVEAFKQPKVVIMGGSTKYADFEALAKVVANNNVRRVVLIGNTENPQHICDTPKLEAALRAAGFSTITSLAKPGGATMQEIVATARDAAEQGDVVLLSAACASFDLFRDYKDRGNQFKTAVQALA